MSESTAPHRYPRGWFPVGLTTEVATGEIKSVHYFGRQMIVYRGEDGVARISDAYCPHLGADIGVGGKVEDNCVRCPFHAWKFGPDGACVEVPYAKRIPPRARIGTYPVDE